MGATAAFCWQSAGAITIFAMPRSRRHPLPVPTWTCPHCGFVHRPADLLRLDSDNLQCRQCKQAFPAVVYRRRRMGERLWPEDDLSLGEISQRLLLEHLLWAESEGVLVGSWLSRNSA
jgi:hypothetical protein